VFLSAFVYVNVGHLKINNYFLCVQIWYICWLLLSNLLS